MNQSTKKSWSASKNILISLLTILFIILSYLFQAAYQPQHSYEAFAQSNRRTPTPSRSSIFRSAPIQTVTIRNSNSSRLPWLSFISGGGGGPSLCNNDNNETLWVSGTLLQRAICSVEPIYDASIISPTGERLDLDAETMGQIYYVAVPLEVYVNEGTWTLQVEEPDHLEYEIDIEKSNDISVYADPTRDLILISGFENNTEVVAVLFDIENDEQVFIYKGHVKFSTSSQGYAFIEGVFDEFFDEFENTRAIAVDEQGNCYPMLFGNFNEMEVNNFCNQIYRSFFPQGSSTTASNTTCETLLRPRLTVGEEARVTPGDSNNLRYLPSTIFGEKIGEIPGNGIFTVLGGPVCDYEDELVWWLVDYNGLTGWTAEGQDGTYWLEPLD